MFKLVLHHTYKLLGEAIDISRNDNHGFRTAVPFEANGRMANSGALRFNSGPSEVRVSTKDVWQLLRAVKIEVWAFVEPPAPARRLNLVEGDRAFAFFMHPDGVLWGTFLGPEVAGGPATWHGANSQAHAPDGVKRTVPYNTWTKLTYVHDGVASLRLYINDELVAANYNLISAVPSVQPTGVHIGHWAGDDRYTFSGLLDEVKIWKYDPDVPFKQFFCRPMTSEQMACWRHVFDQIAEPLRDKEAGRSMIALMLCLWEVQLDLVREIRSRGERAIAQNRRFSRQYRKLWCAGKIDGEEMEAFLRDWLSWLEKLLGPDYLPQFRQRIQSCWEEFGYGDAFSAVGEELQACDPSFAGYIKLLLNIAG